MNGSSAAVTDERPSIWLSGPELELLRTVVAEHLGESAADDTGALEDKLERAIVIPPARMPQHIVRMGSQVRFEDESGRLRVLRLVYPHEAALSHGNVSVLAPVGVALLGLPVGAAFDWALPGGHTARMRIVAVHLSPPGEDA